MPFHELVHHPVHKLTEEQFRLGVTVPRTQPSIEHGQVHEVEEQLLVPLGGLSQTFSAAQRTVRLVDEAHVLIVVHHTIWLLDGLLGLVVVGAC